MRWKALRFAVAGLGVAVGCVVGAPLGAQPEGAWIKPLEEITWQEIVPGVDFGSVYGDFSKEAHGKLARFAPGIASPPHAHTHAYWAVVIQGTVTNPFKGEEDPPEMGPGDSWHVPAGVEHITACVSEEPCLAYAHMNDLWDITVVEWGASEAGEPGE